MSTTETTTTRILPNIYNLGYHCGQFISKTHYNIPPIIDIINAIINFPLWYKEWWLNLYKNDPVHVIVETTLLAAIVYFLVVSRRLKSEKYKNIDKLTEKEENELLLEWKEHTRKPLAPPLHQQQLQNNNNNNTTPMSVINEKTVLPDNYDPTSPSPIIVHKSNGRYLHIEDPSLDNNSNKSDKNTIKQVLNFATFDFLGMQADTLPVNNNDEKDTNVKTNTTDKITSAKSGGPNSPTSSMDTPINNSSLHPVKRASLAALDRYGCGSCGPRGFYGTIDVHLELEKQVATFMGTDDSILYSDGASTVTSTIAAFCKRGDLIVVDEAVYEPIRTGVNLSRANVKWFAHNDMNDLRRVLQQVYDADRKIGRKLNAQRRFIVVEGLYKNTGNICPLDELVKLKHEYKYRLILDESFSFGTIGQTGRGVTELYKQKLMHDAEIVVVSMENSIGSVGALTIGSEEVVDHQRLSGSGYCFSASSPPFTASAAMAALQLLQKQTNITLHKLHTNQVYMYEQMQQILHDKLEDLLYITSDKRSPILLLQVAEIPETEYLDEVVFLQEVVRESLLRGVAFVATGTTNNTYHNNHHHNATDPPPGIRITVSASHTKNDINIAINTFVQSVDVIMSRFHDEEEEEDDNNSNIVGS